MDTFYACFVNRTTDAVKKFSVQSSKEMAEITACCVAEQAYDLDPVVWQLEWILPADDLPF